MYSWPLNNMSLNCASPLVCKVFFLVNIFYNTTWWGFSGGSVEKKPPEMQEMQADMGLIPGLGTSPGEGNGNPLQYSCLLCPWRIPCGDRGVWQAIVHRVSKSRTRLKWLSTHTHIPYGVWLVVSVDLELQICRANSGTWSSLDFSI